MTRLEHVDAQLLFLMTPAVAEQILVAAPNFRSRLTDVLSVVPESSGGFSHLSWEDELEDLAREQGDNYQSILARLMIDQLRHHLSELSNRRKLKQTYELPRLETVEGGLQQLVCEGVEFQSYSTLIFKILMEPGQKGWMIQRFTFHLHLTNRPVQRVSHPP